MMALAQTRHGETGRLLGRPAEVLKRSEAVSVLRDALILVTRDP